MCWFSRLFKPLKLPYPEEPPDYNQTINTVDIGWVIDCWLFGYYVPPEHWNYWRTMIDIKIDTTINYSAGVWEEGGMRHMRVRPEWLNPGVIAHEQAHNSYALLNDMDKQFFNVAYTPLKTTDPLIKLLYSKNAYGLTNDIEGHAEVYRYIGYKMPEVLKQYYPKLF